MVAFERVIVCDESIAARGNKPRTERESFPPENGWFLDYDCS